MDPEACETEEAVGVPEQANPSFLGWALLNRHSETCRQLGITQAAVLAMHETLQSICEAVDCGTLVPTQDGEPAPDQDPAWDPIDQAQHLVTQHQELAEAVAASTRQLEHERGDG